MVGLIVLGISLPNNVMDYGWAIVFVETISPIVPMAKNFANNPDAHPVLPVFYGVLGLLLYVFLVLYFFAEYDAITGTRERGKRFSDKPADIIKLKLFLALMLLLWIIGLIYLINTLGEYQESYGRSSRIFLSLIGSMTFGVFMFVFCGARTAHLLLLSLKRLSNSD